MRIRKPDKSGMRQAEVGGFRLQQHFMKDATYDATVFFYSSNFGSIKIRIDNGYKDPQITVSLYKNKEKFTGLSIRSFGDSAPSRSSGSGAVAGPLKDPQELASIIAREAEAIKNGGAQ